MTQQIERDQHTFSASLADLAERLVAEYENRLSAGTVVRCLEAARHAVRFFGEEPDEQLRLLEHIAREDLTALVSGRDSSARLFTNGRSPRARRQT